MKRLTTLGASIAFALLGQQAMAKGAIDMDEMLAKSDLVFQGKVIDINYKDSKEGLPHTFVTYQVEDMIAGDEQMKQITLRFIGGMQKQGDKVRYLTVSDVPEFEEGENDILFVEKNNQVICPLVSCSKGRYRDLNGVITNEDGQPLLLNQDSKYQLSRESMAYQIGKVNNAKGFARAMSEHEGENPIVAKRGTSLVDTAGFVADLKQRAMGLSKQGVQKSAGFSSSFIKADFSTPFFKEVKPADHQSKSSVPLMPETNRPKSDYDRWEEEELRKNGGDPVITLRDRKPSNNSTPKAK